MTPSVFLLSLAGILLAASIISFIPAVHMRRRDSQLRTRCTSQAKGRVSGYSTSKQVTGSTFLPVVTYRVDGVEYTVTGPTFASYRARTLSGDGAHGHPLTNITYIHDLPEDLCVYEIADDPHAAGNAMREPFPVGTGVDVHYDPAKPSRSYVIRVPATSSFAKVFLFLGAIELVASAIFAFISLLW